MLLKGVTPLLPMLGILPAGALALYMGKCRVAKRDRLTAVVLPLALCNGIEASGHKVARLGRGRASVC